MRTDRVALLRSPAIPGPHRRRPLATALLFALSTHLGAAPPAPTLNAVRALGEGRYELSGEFGATCAACELRIDYRGLRYAVPAQTWQPQRLVAAIPDLNLGLDVRVQVQTARGTTPAQPLRLTPQLVPERESERPLAAIDNRRVHERNHQLAVGDKGEDVFDVSTAAPGCGKPAEVFDRARIVYRERRFGDAQIVALPPSGCVQCPPLKVRWYHEPTGRLIYQLHVYRRIVEAVCPERRR